MDRRAQGRHSLLTTPDEWDAWLGGTIEDAAALQSPLPNQALRIVATGEKNDKPASAVEIAEENGGRPV